MAGDRVTAQAGAHAQARVDTYLGELAHLLRGPRRRRARILAELRDGLDQAIADQIGYGCTEDQAAEAAIDDFGTPQAVADAFAGELATAYARHTIAWYIATGPLVGIWWLLLLQPHPWRTGLVALIIAIPVIPLLPIAIATAAAALATTGRLMRWLPETSATRALTAATAIAAICVAADLTVLGLLSTHLATGRQYPAPLIAVAATASFVRIAAAITAIRSTRARRAQLPST
jgi:HAAS